MLYPILVVEDDPKIANVVRVYLENAGYRVVTTEKGREALALAEKNSPLLVVLDLALDELAGEIVCQELKELGDTPVIMLTSKASEEERLAGFALGADDYMVKPFSPRELVFRVKSLLRRAQRNGAAGREELSFNGRSLVLDCQGYRVLLDGVPLLLTPTEFKILHTLASAPQEVFTRERLLEKALGYSFEGYERSIDAHIKNIRHKIGDAPRNPVFIHTIYGVGYRFGGVKDA